ncbi:hypothetical protein [Actinomadura chibensis]|uniref:Uncharacterized protein n=1 Tax=Actinomadura chibensis TaxID=392828 RepID=A0A5D0NU12_9ACTN|nr:hypothetical protein [Actinomadura chibensis]TYB47819.1 hypothetical protein FXF69_00745 [Actinomadura chibensis]
MSENRWFIPDDPSDITGEERAFANALSDATADLVCPGVWDLLIPAADNDLVTDWLVAALVLHDLPASGEALSLLDFGVHYLNGRIRGSRLHNQTYFLDGRIELDSVGSVEELARLTADWFAWMLRRPVVLKAWLNHNYAYASRYEFADTGQGLVVSYHDGHKPEGQHRMPQAPGGPAPDLIFHIRGDLTLASEPLMLCEQERHGLFPGPWLT